MYNKIQIIEQLLLHAMCSTDDELRHIFRKDLEDIECRGIKRDCDKMFNKIDCIADTSLSVYNEIEETWVEL